MGKEKLKIEDLLPIRWIGEGNHSFFAVRIVEEGIIERKYREKVMKAFYEYGLWDLTNKRTKKRNREYNANIKNVKT